jgi:cell division transport system permease protein
LKRPSQHNTFSSYGTRQLQAAVNSLGQLSRAPFATLLTCLVIGITLALPMALVVLLKNVDVLSEKLQQSTQMTLYLKPDVSEAQALQITQTLTDNPLIKDVRAISPAEGLAELQHQAGISDLLAELQNNPLPWSLAIQPTAKAQSKAALVELGSSLKQLPNVEAMQLDSLWIEKLFTLLSLAHRLIYAFAFFLSLAVLLIINNCIRAATQFHQTEIDIIQLIGATRSFIRRPFLYAGMVYGLLGGIIAWQLVDLLLLWLQTPFKNLMALYGNSFELLGLNLTETLSLLAISLLLGLVGSWFAVTRFLQTRKA